MSALAISTKCPLAKCLDTVASPRLADVDIINDNVVSKCSERYTLSTNYIQKLT